MKNDKKILICLYVLIGLLLINTIVLAARDFSKGNNSDVKNTDGDTNQGDNNPDYNVSMFQTLDVSGVLKLFDQNDLKVVYVGRSTCGACIHFLPTLQEAQNKYGYKTVYLDLDKIDKNHADFTKLINKMDKNYTMEKNDGPVTKAFGKYLSEEGYTPEVFIIKNGKMANGIIGAFDIDAFSDFLEENGVKK